MPRRDSRSSKPSCPIDSSVGRRVFTLLLQGIREETCALKPGSEYEPKEVNMEAEQIADHLNEVTQNNHQVCLEEGEGFLTPEQAEAVFRAECIVRSTIPISIQVRRQKWQLGSEVNSESW